VGNEEVKEKIYLAPPLDGAPSNGAPHLVTFVCDWCLRADADVRVLESYRDNVRIVHIPCTGRIDPEMALLALRSGIDGVLVCGCQPGECHYQRGTLISACKIGLLGRMLDHMQIGSGRVRFVQIGTQDRGRIRSEVDAMLENLVSQEEVA
jgi:coenzyme F420-reducing hydrogenase delta subunit